MDIKHISDGNIPPIDDNSQLFLWLIYVIMYIQHISDGAVTVGNIQSIHDPIKLFFLLIYITMDIKHIGAGDITVVTYRQCTKRENGIFNSPIL